MRSAIPKDIVLEGEPVEEELTADLLDELNEQTPGGEDSGHDSILFGDDGDIEELDDGAHSGDSGAHSKRLLGFYAPSYTAYPWRTVGKVFFTMNGGNYVCSGSVLRPYLVATAGHCVFDNGAWATQWTFVPGYNNGARPYGTYYYYQLWSHTTWTGSRRFQKDYGFAVMNKLNGNPIGNVVGWLGYSYGASYSQYFRALGYPQAAPFNGAWNYYVDSNSAGTDAPGGYLAPNTNSINSDATGGASGGPWVIGWGGVNQLNSVNSYKYGNQPNRMFGPYFDADWFSVMSSALAVTPP